MNKKFIEKNTTSYEKNLLESLKEQQEAQAYLEVALDDYEESGAIEVLLLSIKDVAKAQGGIGKLAKNSGINREHLYRILSGKSIPRLDNILHILSALGFRMKLELQIKKAA